MSNVTIVQQARNGNGTVKPLLVSSIKSIVSREELKNLLEIEARAEAAWNERSEFGKAPGLIEAARDTLRNDPTAANRERLDALVEKYGTPEQCGHEEDIRYSQLDKIERVVPAAVYPVLRRVENALGEVHAELANAERKAFEEVGFVYTDGADASPVLLLVIEAQNRLKLLVAKVKRNQYTGFQSPSTALENYLDLATIKKDGLSPTLPVPHDVPEPIVAVSPREQAFRDNITNPPPLIDRKTNKPVKPPLPGIDMPGYGTGQPETINSDGEFSKTLGKVAVIPNRV